MGWFTNPFETAWEKFKDFFGEKMYELFGEDYHATTPTMDVRMQRNELANSPYLDGSGALTEMGSEVFVANEKYIEENLKLLTTSPAHFLAENFLLVLTGFVAINFIIGFGIRYFHMSGESDRLKLMADAVKPVEVEITKTKKKTKKKTEPQLENNTKQEIVQSIAEEQKVEIVNSANSVAVNPKKKRKMKNEPEVVTSVTSVSEV